MKKRFALLLALVFATVVLGACNNTTPSDDELNSTIVISVTSDKNPSLYVGDEYTLQYTITDVFTKPTASVVAEGENVVGIFNRAVNKFFALGLGTYKLTIICNEESRIFETINITVVERAVSGGLAEPDPRFNFDSDSFEVLDDKEGEDELWSSVPIHGRFGNEGKVDFNYYQGDDGIYLKAMVKDDNLYSARTGLKGSSAIEDSDRVEFHLDLDYDKGTAPQIGDWRIRVDLMGNFDVSTGTGSSWRESTVFRPDRVSAGLIGGYTKSTVTQRSAVASSVSATELDVDLGYVVKVFISYSNFGFTKRDAYGLTLAHADYMSLDGAQVFVAAGDEGVPNKFRPLSAHGFGTDYQLEAKIDGKADDAIYSNTARTQTFTINNMVYGGDSSRGTVSVTTKIAMGEKGMYIAVNSQQEYIMYTYSNHTWQSDHLEIRVDADNSESSTTPDIFMHFDVAGTLQTAFGITDGSRSAGTYNLIAFMGVTGEMSDVKTGAATKNIGSTDPKTINIEIYIPYSSMSVTASDTFGAMISLGNYKSAMCNVGYLFNTAGLTDEGSTNVYNTYNKYQKFTVPADAVA